MNYLLNGLQDWFTPVDAFDTTISTYHKLTNVSGSFL